MIYPTIGSLALFLRPYVVYYSHNNINICVYIVIIVVIKSQFIIYDQLNLLEIIFEIIFSFQIQEISPRRSSCRDFVGQYPPSPGGLPHHLSPPCHWTQPPLTCNQFEDSFEIKTQTRRCTTVRDSEGQTIPCKGGSVWVMWKWSMQWVSG